MSLAGYTPEYQQIEIRRPKGDKPALMLTVRGLNLADFGAMIAEHLGEIEQIYNEWIKDKTRLARMKSLDGFFTALCTHSPGLVAEVISRAADEPHEQDKAAQLPFSVQVVALSHIARMTFEEAGGLPNLSAALVTLLTESLGVSEDALATGPLNNLLNLKSSTSIGDAEETLHS